MPKLSTVAHLGKAVTDALKRGAPDIELSTLPTLLDLSSESLTENVIAINAQTPDPRQKFVNEVLIKHLHEFVREVALTSEEWMTAIEFLTKTGQTCTDLRQEFILLSDVFGVSALVDVLNHPKPKGATESTVLGPFFVEDSQTIQNGESIASEGKGDQMLVKGQVRDLQGHGIPNCLIETWETDQDGFYDTQYEGFEADCRGRLYTDKEGYFAFRGIVPVAYPIPNDGPVGQLLRSMKRHVFRPAHLHMMFQANGFKDLITSLYFKGDIFLTRSGVILRVGGNRAVVDRSSDAVFGVKSSLVEDPITITSDEKARKAGFKSGPFLSVERDFVLITDAEAADELEKLRNIV